MVFRVQSNTRNYIRAGIITTAVNLDTVQNVMNTLPMVRVMTKKRAVVIPSVILKPVSLTDGLTNVRQFHGLLHLNP